MDGVLLRRGLKGLAIAGVFLAVSWLAVTWAYGGFDDDYELVGVFPKAGQGLVPGSDVSYRGVDVGEVGSVDLVDRQARVTMRMDPDFDVPPAAEVVVRPKTVFGEKFVDMEFPRGAEGPYLEDGDVLENTQSASEVEDFIDGSADLFAAVDADDLATVISELSQAAEGSGRAVASSIESSAEATTLFADTIEPQIEALESWAAFQDAIRSTGQDFNAISRNQDLALAEFNANADSYRRVLTALRPFAEDFAQLLVASRPDIDRMIERGDNVVRVLLANERELSEVITGLGNYVQTFAEGFPQERLPDGSIFAYFKASIPEGAVEALICTELGAAPEEFAPLRDAMLAVAEGNLDCSDHFEPSSDTASGPAPERSEAELAAAARQVVEDLFGQVAAPEDGEGAGVGQLISPLAGGAP